MIPWCAAECRLSNCLPAAAWSCCQGTGSVWTSQINHQIFCRMEKLDVYRLACRKGTDWLLRWMNADGSVGPVEERLFYYRLPWTLTLMGEITAASRILDWICTHMFTPEGAFEGLSPQGLFASRYGSYPLACLLVGATLQQRHDIVYPATNRLLSWQDSESGGFYNTLPDVDGEQDLFPTAQGGMALIQVGRIEAALSAGNWFQRVWEAQPDVQSKLYAVYGSSRLVTDFPEDQAQDYVTLKDKPWQYHYNGGIAAAFLTKLHQATGNSDWLDLARNYQAFSTTTDECQFQSMQMCKSGWGSGLLYTVTREAIHRDWTFRMGDWFVEHQFDDGRWENTKYWNPNPALADNIELTTEFVMHLSHIISHLSV